MIKQLPNLITLLNLFCGCIAAMFAINNNFIAAAIFVCLGIFFDFFDGLLARLLKAQSPLGIQLDSLADLVTSGVVPGIVMYKLLLIATETQDIMRYDFQWSSTEFSFLDFKLPILPLLGLTITLASAYRLARFNIDEDQQDYFKGLPVPANTLLIISLPLILEFQNSNTIVNLILNPWFLVSLTVLSCYLLNCKLKLFALKFKTWDLKSNLEKYSLLLISMLLLVSLRFIAVPLIIFIYILLSILTSTTIKE